MADVMPVMAVNGIDAAADCVDDARDLLDERAFHVFYSRTAAPLRAYIARTLGSATQADDLLQETYLRLLRRPLPTRDPDELRAYAYRIASNLVVDYWRAHRHETGGEVPDRPAADRDPALRLDVGRIFARLKPRERQLVWLAHMEGAPHTEIAATLGLRAGSVRVLLSRARSRFARLLRESGHVGKGER
jgi:RNA polymerase sigma-70 factor (ECF subfamily)